MCTLTNLIFKMADVTEDNKPIKKRDVQQFGVLSRIEVTRERSPGIIRFMVSNYSHSSPLSHYIIRFPFSIHRSFHILVQTPWNADTEAGRIMNRSRLR